MNPNELLLRTQPPDHPLDDQMTEEGEVDSSPSMNEGKGNRVSLSNANEKRHEEGRLIEADNRGKMQRTSGSFTGKVSLQPREEEWMDAKEEVPETPPQEKMSYREAVKPKTAKEQGARKMYARMCVEVDLNAPLLSSYTIDGNQPKIEYEDFT